MGAVIGTGRERRRHWRDAISGYERPAIAGSGAIACGLAACASALGEVIVLLAPQRRVGLACRATSAQSAAAKLDGAIAGPRSR